MRKRLAVAISALLLLAYNFWPVSAGTQPLAQLDSVTAWHIPEPWFGGFSGIEVSKDGMSFVTISDRSHFAMGRFERNDNRIKSVSLVKNRPMLTSKGRQLTAQERDSEGLAQVNGNKFLVSFEGQDRVELFESPGGKSDPLPGSKIFEGLRLNGALEALAIDADGSLFAIAERATGNTDEALVFLFEKGVWTQPFAFERNKGFDPVGADFGPDGRLYLLERGFNVLGFRSRVRRFDVTQSGFENDTELFRSISGTHDNLEGLSVWRDNEGQIRLVMISDDNFLFLQRTEIVEYVVR